MSAEYEFSSEAKEFLSTIKGPIAIISMAGLFRTGKSFFLNRVLLQQDSGFGVGSTINACTRGIWLWTGVIAGQANGKPISVIIADTEGMASTEADQNHDQRIFTLALLTSSHFIYNSKGTIDEDAISKLYLSAELAGELQSKSGEGFGDEDYEKLFPYFMWIVRDFMLGLQDEKGRKISDDEYLERGLAEVKGKGKKETNGKN